MIFVLAVGPTGCLSHLSGTRSTKHWNISTRCARTSSLEPELVVAMWIGFQATKATGWVAKGHPPLAHPRFPRYEWVIGCNGLSESKAKFLRAHPWLLTILLVQRGYISWMLVIHEAIANRCVLMFSVFTLHLILTFRSMCAYIQMRSIQMFAQKLKNCRPRVFIYLKYICPQAARPRPKTQRWPEDGVASRRSLS